ncbi:hypothetical protein GOP47_0013500 [Adiantum capillus-veneris]|uniref:Uncharacterized protein n=1 Tax=Adiantum capillus-veneris TaxID=13818 RepID=A0A9D4UP68_ADICA|nr:hypothetical protein GOP47_0013500 [Adiantum capillus-veneris]
MAATGASAVAHHKPEFVYRGDTRPPEEIFKDGFKARGGADAEDDLLAHVEGGLNLLKTGYISTSQSLRTPAAFLKPVFKSNHQEDAYVDPKDPTIKYNRRIGWIYYINTTGLDMVYVPDKLHQKHKDKYGYQQEWAVKGSIPGHNIQQAHHVDGYIKRYSDLSNMKQGVDPIFPPDKPNPFKEITKNKGYAHEKKK